MYESDNNLLKINNLDVSYNGDNVINDLSLIVSSGSFIGLIGSNGAGKTTLLLSISGQFKPSSGIISFRNSDIYERNYEYKGEIGYVSENPFFYRFLTVEEHLYFISGIRKVERNNKRRTVDEIISLFRLGDIKDKSTSALSPGMQKKLANASAFIGDPLILFLDKALNGIDIENSFRIIQALTGYVDKGGTVILSTHIPEVIEKICNRFLVMKDGKIIADVDAHEHRYTGSRTGHKDLEDYVITPLNS